MKYFGTDGIRDLANKGLGPEFVLQIGKAIGGYLQETYPHKEIHVCIGRDPRESGSRIEKNITDGLQSVGIHCHLFGIVPTPAVSELCKKQSYQMGIVISASHNPYPYNGIKLFNEYGEKASEEAEIRIETLLDCPWLIQETPGLPGSVTMEENAAEEYVQSIVSMYSSLSLKGYSVLVDCANGATSYTTPATLRSLGATVVALHTKQDGSSINKNCGSLHPEVIKNYLAETGKKFDFIFSHDGDGDRVIAFDTHGNVVDGDHMITAIALTRKQKNSLPNDTIVGTVMTNEGIIEFLKKKGIQFHRSKVGDKYVYRDMIRLSSQVGGEQSGHLLFLDRSSTGDGLISALEYMQAFIDNNNALLQEMGTISLYEQNLTNVPVQNKNTLLESVRFQEEIQRVQNEYPEARMVFRPSGTEPLFRVLVETPDRKKTDQLVQRIVTFIKALEG